MKRVGGGLALLEVAQMWGLRRNKCGGYAPTPSAASAGKMDALPLTIPSGNVRIKGKLERTGKLEK